MALYLLDKNKDGASILAKTLEQLMILLDALDAEFTSNDLCKVCSDNSRDAEYLCG